LGCPNGQSLSCTPAIEDKRRVRGRVLKFLLLAVIVGSAKMCAAAPAEAFAGADGEWRRYESPHFELFSHTDDRESRNVLSRLELLHALFSDIVYAQEQRPNLVTIYFFDTENAFRAYAPASMGNQNLAGYYLNRPDRSVIVLSPVWQNGDAPRLIFHEYIHHLSRLSGDEPALWYNEGLAELFSTLEERNQQMLIGATILPHVLLLRTTPMMPLADLFSVGHSSRSYNESERSGLFYAQSWAMVHYLYCGSRNQSPERRAARDRFLDLVRHEGEKGNPLAREQLFKQCFGTDYAEELRELERYIRNGSYDQRLMPRPQIPSADTYVMTPVARDEIQLRLAELALRVNRSPAAKRTMLEAAAKLPPDVRAYEILGTDAYSEGDLSTTRQRWAQAVEAGTKNPGVIHELAVLEGDDWFSRLDVTFELPESVAKRLRELTLLSIERAPNQTKAYEILAWVEATAKKPNPENINLVQAHLPALRPRERAMLALALIRIHMSDFATARMILDQAEKEAEAPQATRWAATLRDYANQQEARAAQKH
jgi:hypothetical protein